MWVLSWLIGSKIGRYVAMGLVVAGILTMVAYSLFRRGVDQERAKQIAASLENLRSRIATDDEISRLSAAERRRRLSQSWGLPDDR
jgi:hypothetical protein